MPETLKHVYPSPLFYHNHETNKEYIIICPLYEDTRNIYIYSCSDDTWEILTQYPLSFDPICHTNVIDPIHNDLIIFGGFNKIFGKFNLLTLEWKIYCDSDKNQNQLKYNIAESSHGRAIFLPDPLNEIHAMIPYRNDERNLYHLKYEEKDDQFISASEDGINENGKLFRSQMVTVRVDGKQYILMIGGYHNNSRRDEIWFCEVRESMDCEWKLFPKRLPLRNYAKVVVVFERVLVIMIGDINDNDEKESNYQLVYCLEIDNFMDNNGNEWVRCNVCAPITFKMGLSEDNYIYCMNHYDPQQHSKIHISNVIPYDVYRKYLA